jgi:hypothetical protein
MLIRVLLWLLLWCTPALGHDWKRPDLDAWYGSLKNPRASSGVVRDIGCCSKEDCHETEAEMRGNDWWARLGSQHRVKAGIDWELADWVKVPAEAVLLHQTNPTGSAVICHSVTLTDGGRRIDPAASTVFCFVPPSES